MSGPERNTNTWIIVVLSVVVVLLALGVTYLAGVNIGAREASGEIAAEGDVLENLTSSVPESSVSTSVFKAATTTTRSQPELVYNTVSVLGGIAALSERINRINEVADQAMDERDFLTLRLAAEDLRSTALEFRDLARDATDPIARDALYAYEAGHVRRSYGLGAVASGIELGDVDLVRSSEVDFREGADFLRDASAYLDDAMDRMWTERSE